MASLDEEELLARVLPLLGPSRALVGNGDDAAVLAAPDGRYVVSTDVLVEDRHFRREWSSGFDVGWRAVMQNVADMAAMGARPTHLVVALVLPGSTPVAWAEDLARGLHAACERHGADVVGGDLSGGDELVVAATVHGDLEGRPAVLRSGARAGDVVAHAGVRGWSAAGLALLTSATDPSSVAHGERLVRGFLRPEPPVALGAVAADAGATALMDVSDGLLRDADRLARASRVTLDLDEPTEAFAEDAATLAPAARLLGQDVLRWLLAGGEDHGLLATFPAGTPLPAGYRAVGSVREPAERPVLVTGRPVETATSGWDHFAAR